MSTQAGLTTLEHQIHFLMISAFFTKRFSVLHSVVNLLPLQQENKTDRIISVSYLSLVSFICLVIHWPQEMQCAKKGEKKAERVRFHISLETIVFLTCTTYFDTPWRQTKQQNYHIQTLIEKPSKSRSFSRSKLYWKLNSASSEQTKKIK